MARHRSHRTQTSSSKEKNLLHHAYKPSSKPIKLSSNSQRKIDLALAHGWSPSTRTNYASAVRRFIAFCEDEGIRHNEIFPASEVALCAFAASHAGVRAGTTARNNIAAVKAWHGYYNAQWNGGTRLRYILSGVSNLAPPSAARPKRLPITTAMLNLLVSKLDHSKPFDACVLATALTAFWGQCRLGELLPFATTADPKKRPLTHHLTLRPTRGSSTSMLHLPSTKNAPVRGEDVALIARADEMVDAPRALFHHIKVNNLLRHDPLFSYRTRDSGPSRRLTSNAFLARCNEIWTANGFPRSTGHAFRIGGTTEFLISGVDANIVRAMGRWSSDSFLKYWRSLDHIVPKHVSALSGGRPSARRTKGKANRLSG